MSQADYDRWVAAGKPFTLVRPLRELRAVLRGHGYVVYDIGNMDHLLHEPPEDHTPYSETGWPGDARFGYGYAIDIMPPKAGSGLPSLAALAKVLHDERQAGRVPWLKYMNWEPGDGRCLHCSWQPGHEQRASSDRGHIHISARTGYEEASAAGYDPVAQIRGDDMSAQAESEIHNVYAGLFFGGNSMGRAVDPDGAGAAKASNSLVAKLDYLLLRVDTLAAQVAQLQGKDFTDEPAIIAGVLAGLPAEKIAAALPPELAKQLADELARRMAS